MIDNFTARVNGVVASIPRGHVMTYGQIAAICGNAAAARIVGGIAHFGDPNLPWQRVVNKSGGTASGYPGGKKAHQKHLEDEGVIFKNDKIADLQQYLWHPHKEEYEH